MSIFWVEQPPDPTRPGYRCWHFLSHNAIHGQAWFQAACEIDSVGGLRQTVVSFTVIEVWRDQRMGRPDGKLLERAEECFLLDGWADEWAAKNMELVTKVYYDEDGDLISAFLKAGGIAKHDSWEERREARSNGPEPRRLPPPPEPRAEINNSPEPPSREHRWRHAD